MNLGETLDECQKSIEKALVSLFSSFFCTYTKLGKLNGLLA